jgi:hypothetical protein
VPPNYAAIVPQARPGVELACKALNYDFNDGGRKRPRGVISYYAAGALPGVATVGEWLRAMNALAEADLKAGVIKALYQPNLQAVGNAERRLAGESALTR